MEPFAILMQHKNFEEKSSLGTSWLSKILSCAPNVNGNPRNIQVTAVIKVICVLIKHNNLYRRAYIGNTMQNSV